MLKHTLGMAGLIGVLALFNTGAAQATAVTTFNATLASPAASPPTSNFYNGSGNPDTDFVITNSNGIEAALRAKYRQSPTTLTTIGGSDVLDHVYHVNAGLQDTNHALWNYEFSIDLQPGGSGGSGLTLNDILPYSTLTIINNTLGQSSTVSLSHWSDNSAWGPSGEETFPSANAGLDWGLQNSENPKFADFPLASLYDASANDFFTFILNVKNASGEVLATDWMGVQVGNADIPTSPTPEPASLALLGAGLAGLGFMRRKSVFG